MTSTQTVRNDMKPFKTFRILTVAVLTLIAAQAMAEPGEKIESRQASTSWYSPLQFDVAESMPKFMFDEAPVLPSGMPAYGNPFITQGYIYPYGTLEGTNGVLADGSPEFPDIVIGEWTCRGYFVGNGAETTTGPWVITTQHYDFYEEAGFSPGKQSTRSNLVTDGYEIADVGVEATRAVTGGTGKYKRARGEARQTLLGFNASEGVNLRFKIRTK